MSAVVWPPLGSLSEIRGRIEAATPGPWEAGECSPCTARGRLDVTVWANNGNALIAGWHDDDEFHPGDAELIAHAPTDLTDLLGAVDAVLALHHRTESGDARIAGPVCAECSQTLDGQFTFHPCPTVEAITDRLRDRIVSGHLYGLLASDDEYLHGSRDLEWIMSLHRQTPGSHIIVKREDGWHDYTPETTTEDGK